MSGALSAERHDSSSVLCGVSEVLWDRSGSLRMRSSKVDHRGGLSARIFRNSHKFPHHPFSPPDGRYCDEI